jgi:transcriptional regulator with XRE-family HTH domain
MPPDQPADGVLPGMITRLRTAISDSDMTQDAVAKAAGMDPTALSKALTGKRGISSLEFARICETLDLSPMILLQDDFKPPVPHAEDIARVRRAAELDALLTRVGYPPQRDRHYPATLLDRAIEAWLSGHLSIRPIAGLIGADTDDLLAGLPQHDLRATPGEGGERCPPGQ